MTRQKIATRKPLSSARVLHAAVALADEAGLEAFSMRGLAQELSVVPMALYKHVANKEELLDGMVDIVFGEIELPSGDLDWRSAMRCRAISTREALQRHIECDLSAAHRGIHLDVGYTWAVGHGREPDIAAYSTALDGALHLAGPICIGIGEHYGLERRRLHHN